MKLDPKSKQEAIIKTFTWRILASLTTVSLAWFFTGELKTGLAIGSTEFIVKLVLYYWHERAWSYIPGIISSKATERA